MSDTPDQFLADIDKYMYALVLRDVRRLAARLSVAAPPQVANAAMHALKPIVQQFNTMMGGERSPAADNTPGDDEEFGSSARTYSDGRPVFTTKPDEDNLYRTIIHHYIPGQPDDPTDPKELQPELCPSCAWQPLRDHFESLGPREGVDVEGDLAILELVRLGFVELSPDAPDDERYTDEEIAELFYGSPSDDLSARVLKDSAKRDQPKHES